MKKLKRTMVKAVSILLAVVLIAASGISIALAENLREAAPATHDEILTPTFESEENAIFEPALEPEVSTVLEPDQIDTILTLAPDGVLPTSNPTNTDIISLSVTNIQPFPHKQPLPQSIERNGLSSNQVTIEYRGNGHTSGTVPTSHTHTLPSSVSLKQPGTMAKTNHTFGGWRDSAGNVFPAGFTWSPTSGGKYIFDAVWNLNQTNQVTIEYRGNGHTSGTVPTSHTHTLPSSVTLKQPGTMAKTNHTFGGWRDTGGNVFPAGFTWSPTSGGKYIFDAVWNSIVMCTVTFNPNGGSVSPTTKTVQSGTAVGTLPTPTRSGHTFAGWFTAQTGGTQITSATIVNGNVTYWARWNSTVTFNPNGGSVNPTTKTVQSGTAVGTLPTPTMSGYTFAGWFTAQTGGTQITSATVVNGNVTYWARWSAKNVTLTFNGNGGVPLTQVVIRQAGTIMGTMPTRPTQARHNFVGWFNTSLTTGGTRFTTNSIVPSSNTNYWARWVDRVRHRDFWWPAADSGTTSVPLSWPTIDSSLGNIWGTSIGNGRTVWDSSTAPVDFYYHISSNNTITAGPSSDTTYLGRLWPTQTSGTSLIRFDIELNATTISQYVANNPTFTLSNVIQSVMAHELGHAIGLEDGFFGNPHTGVNNGSLMNYDRNRNTVFGPTAFDITSVRMVYN